ncbi:MAG: lysoplasmalogenase [Sphingobacteriales bacterium]|nr:lysoplasmalogenase [Sphingobacteriales bacterium]
MIYLILYFINGALTIFAEHQEFRTLMYVSKALMMPLLAIYFFTETKRIKEYRFIYIALFFSWWGDIFLMFPRSEYEPANAKVLFVCGLVSFLIAHINYIVYFFREIKGKPKVTVIIERPYLIIPFLLLGISLLILLYPTLSPMKLPVTVYTIVIISMLIAAFNRKNMVTPVSFTWVFIGALFFVFSDSCIAINLFYKPFASARAVIMSTYIMAQFLIISGVLKQILTRQQS